MGKIRCLIHGDQYFYEVCEHIWDSFQNEIFPKMYDLPVLQTKICDNCYSNYKIEELGALNLNKFISLTEKEQIYIEEKINTKYDKIKTKATCIECINNIKLIDAKRNKKELPFEPFKNTLMYNNQDKIDELKKKLISNFRFQNFKNPYLENIEAFHIQSGDISYPLSIKFYYITKKEEQIKLVKLIADFFTEIPQKQRKISFYEAENLIIEKRGSSISQ